MVAFGGSLPAGSRNGGLYREGQLTSVRINGIEYSTNSKIANGGIINTTVCDFDCITVLMTKTAPGKNEHNIYFNFVRGQAGNYIVTGNNLTNQSGYSCPRDSVYFGTNFADDDWVMDSYQLISDSVNQLKILRYDRGTGVIEGEFGGKFVRNNPVQKSSDAVDTLVYTQGGFLLEGLQTSDSKTGPR